MTCYHPLKAWRLHGTGKPTFNPDFTNYPVSSWQSIQLPCGNCIGCRLDYSRNWAIRCVHEASTHERNCFLTLTFNDKFLEKECPNGSLNKRTMQLFWKRFRKKFPNIRIRYFQCGEYGSQHKRPHYHAIVFGFDFDDKVLFKYSHGVPIYISKTLDSLWSDPESGESFGWSTIGSVSFESCAYVARYVLKKVKGKEAPDFYGDLLPEYTAMSRRPGIAYDWFMKNSSDVYPGDFCLQRISGANNFMKCKPPRYYDEIYDNIHPDVMRDVKAKRIQALSKHNSKDCSSDRLAAREQVKRSQVSRLIRPLEVI